MLPGLVPPSGDDINAANNMSLMLGMRCSLPDALDTYTSVLRIRPASQTTTNYANDAAAVTVSRSGSGLGVSVAAFSPTTGMQRYMLRNMMFHHTLLANGTGAQTPNWLAIDMFLSTSEPTPPHTDPSGLCLLDTPWPNGIFTANSQMDSADILGFVHLSEAGETGSTANLRQVFATQNTTLAATRTLTPFGYVRPQYGLCQLSVRDLAYYRDATENEIQVASTDCGVFSLQAVQYSPTSFGGSLPFAQIGAKPSSQVDARLVDLGAFVTVPGGWHTIPRIYTNASVAILASGNRYLRQSELDLAELQSPVVRIPPGTAALVVRGWSSVSYGSARTLMTRLAVSVW